MTWITNTGGYILSRRRSLPVGLPGARTGETPESHATRRPARRPVSLPGTQSLDWDGLVDPSSLLPPAHNTEAATFLDQLRAASSHVVGPDFLQDPITPQYDMMETPAHRQTHPERRDPTSEIVEDKSDADSFAKQIRTFRSAIDDLLLRRTQLRHELLLLESCRKQFMDNLKELFEGKEVQPSESSIQRSPTSQKKKRRSRAATGQKGHKANRSRDVASADVSRIVNTTAQSNPVNGHKYEEGAEFTTPAMGDNSMRLEHSAELSEVPLRLSPNYEIPEQHLETPWLISDPFAGSREMLNSASDESTLFESSGHREERNQRQVESPDIEKPARQPQSLSIDSCYRAYEDLCEQELTINKHTDSLSNLEFRLTERIASILKTMHSSNFADTLRAEMLDETLSVSDINSPTASLSGIHPLLTEYYARQGEIGVLIERIQENEFTHDEGKEARDFLADRSDSLEVSDKEFERNHSERRQEIEQELHVARQDALRLQRLCEALGLDPMAHRTADPSLYTGSAAFASRDQYDDESEPQKIREVRYDPAMATGRVEPFQRIGGWLKGMASRTSFDDGAEEHPQDYQNDLDGRLLDASETND